jgi:hypothetical protein
MTVKFGLAPLSNKHLSDSSLPCLAATKDKEWLLLSTASQCLDGISMHQVKII